jgi:ubiquinone/menaquinone biosynthesis C-methylase UbiE
VTCPAGSRYASISEEGDAMPVGADHEAKAVEQFSQMAEGYSRLTKRLSHGRQFALIELIRPAVDDVALDVCCGAGSLALDLAPLVARVTGLDFTPAMLDQARLSQAETGVANVEWVEGNAYRMPFADGAFSLVLCSSALHHIGDPRAAFAEMVRVCRPGGRIVVRDITPAPSKTEIYDAFERLRDPSHVHAMSPAELTSLGEGFPLGPPVISRSVARHLPLEAVLGISFPEADLLDHLRELLLDDALSCEDRLGFDARFIGGQLRVSFPQTAAIWERL